MAMARMNKLEAKYAQRLDCAVAVREIVSWSFESLKFRLANRCWYTPDFIVTLPDGRLEAHEVKGFWRDDARVKWKAAADQWPAIRFVAVTRAKGEWRFEEYGP